MSLIERDTILVPTDFTPVADCALDHAIEIAKLFKHKIRLLHVVAKKNNVEQLEKIEKRFSRICSSVQSQTGLDVSWLVEEGSIFDVISKTADQIEAEFIVMGIHGKRGVQFILGSYAYKVICSSKIPVLVVKNKHHHVGYHNIVVPIDFSTDSTRKVNKAIKFARYFDSVIHLIGILNSSSSVYRIQKEALLKNVTDYILHAGVQVKSKVLVRPGSELDDEVIHYAQSVDADLIMIVAETAGHFAELFGRNDAEQIIDKSDIPVLTVIPSEEDDDDSDNDNVFSPFIDPLGLIDK